MCILSTCLSKSSIGTGCRPDKHKADLGLGRNLLNHQNRLPVDRLENCSQVDCLQYWANVLQKLPTNMGPKTSDTTGLAGNCFYNTGSLSTFKTRNVCVVLFALLAEERWGKRDVERQIFSEAFLL